MTADDKDLGMFNRITRRDFLQGSAVLCAAPLVPGFGHAAGAMPTGAGPDYYPPILGGLRGSHPGSFETAHALTREGRRWADVSETGEPRYDLVVVGGGISGLCSAYLYREALGQHARILILDNHDDFGGHAKRNEFALDGHLRLAWGGSINLEYPGYSANALGLLKKLGVDFRRLNMKREFSFASIANLRHGLYFDAETYGRDVLIKDLDRYADRVDAELLGIVDRIPVSRSAQRALGRFLSRQDDLLAPMTPAERIAYLRKSTYSDFLTQRAGLPDEAVQVFGNWTHGLWGAGIDVLPVYECLILGLPGYHVIGELPAVFEQEKDDDFAMFPDGNASVARLLVRALVPGVAAGKGMDDIVTARFHYQDLDRARNNVRIRLNSTAIEVGNNGLGTKTPGVTTTYVQDGRAWRVRSKHCVLACYHNIIPHLCAELSLAQIKAIAYPTKVPMLVTNVLLRNGEAMDRSGICSLSSPGRLHAHSFLAAGVPVGDYQGTWRPDQPAVVQFFGSPVRAGTGKTAKEQYRVGRHRLLGMGFADFEREVRQHLAGAYGAAGFDPARDISAITVNRWPHGYAYEYISSEDPDWLPGTAPHEIARRPVGRIAIANSDASAFAYVDGAIDAAYAAIADLLT